MTSRYSEEEAVQKPAGELLRRMGWDVHYCFDDEVLGPVARWVVTPIRTSFSNATS